jgi:sulfite reductase (NADPH) flavoprotein alpha-component
LESCTDGEMTFRAGPRGYIDKLMKEPGMVTRLWELMTDRRSGGEEATFYVCGQASLFKTVLSALKFVSEANGVDPDVTLAKMFADHRLQSEVYMPPVTRADVPQFFPSEIARHTNKEHGFWILINDAGSGVSATGDAVSTRGGKVYEVSDFLNLHPGGTAIIRANCGVDATHVFCESLIS